MNKSFKNNQMSTIDIFPVVSNGVLDSVDEFSSSADSKIHT